MTSSWRLGAASKILGVPGKGDCPPVSAASTRPFPLCLSESSFVFYKDILIGFRALPNPV